MKKVLEDRMRYAEIAGPGWALAQQMVFELRPRARVRAMRWAVFSRTVQDRRRLPSATTRPVVFAIAMAAAFPSASVRLTLGCATSRLSSSALVKCHCRPGGLVRAAYCWGSALSMTAGHFSMSDWPS